ncbi:hypothetical protein [Tsukamurella spumae]|uniref:DUF4386 family protein n=1 Tax=Tsukamurella spumae TaxID=44753 RepID=A0A846X342_9ACTN|nr:hypothetical protein [Tsukamurella spumae]NKY19573.1 hypothetical protein [Tsukamurella spumae]
MTVSRPTRADLWWLLAVALLAFAFFAVPPLFFGSGFESRAAMEFSSYLLGDSERLPAGLQALVDDWSRYHAVKAVFAGLLVAVAVHRGHHALALIPAVLLLANIQGTLAPLSSALSLIDPARERDGELARALARMRTELGGAPSGPVSVIVRDFAWYHAVLAALAGTAIVVLLAFAVRAWRHGRRRWAAATGAAAVATGVVIAANISTVLDPVRGLLDFLGGS